MAKPCAIPECVSLRTKDSYLCAAHQADADNKRKFSTPETPAEPKAHKYHAIPTMVDGIRFDSKREAEHYQDLRLMAKAGVIRDLHLQPCYALIIVSTTGEYHIVGEYRADFQFFDIEQNRVRVQDIKGVDTPLSRLKRKIVKARDGIDVEIVS